MCKICYLVNILGLLKVGRVGFFCIWFVFFGNNGLVIGLEVINFRMLYNVG